MTRPRDALQARRAQLIERAGTQRDQIARDLSEWQKPLRNVDRGLAVYRGLKRSVPVIGFGAGIGMAALAFIRPDGITSWMQKGIEIWRLLTEHKRMARAAQPAAEPASAAPQVAERTAAE